MILSVEAYINIDKYTNSKVSLLVKYWRKYVHEVLVNRLGGLSLSRKSVVRLTDRPAMTLDVYRGRKSTIQYNTSCKNMSSSLLYQRCENILMSPATKYKTDK